MNPIKNSYLLYLWFTVLCFSHLVSISLELMRVPEGVPNSTLFGKDVFAGTDDEARWMMEFRKNQTYYTLL